MAVANDAARDDDDDDETIFDDWWQDDWLFLEDPLMREIDDALDSEDDYGSDD